MSVMAGPELVVDPETDPQWLDEVQRFVEDAAGRGTRVEVRVRTDEPSYSPEAAAQLLHVSRTTVRRAIQAGEIKAFKHGTHWRIPASEIHEFNRTLSREIAEYFADDELY